MPHLHSNALAAVAVAAHSEANRTVGSAVTEVIMGGSGEDKYDHPTRSRMELMRRPLLNHSRCGEWVYEPFLGSGTTLAAVEQSGRLWCGWNWTPSMWTWLLSDGR